MFQVRLINELNEHACTRRNALTETPAKIALSAGTVGTVLEVLDNVMRYSSSSAAEATTAAIGLAFCTQQKSSVWPTHKLPEPCRTLEQASCNTVGRRPLVSDRNDQTRRSLKGLSLRCLGAICDAGILFAHADAHERKQNHNDERCA